MVEISLRTCFRDFNAPSFVFYLAVSIFSVLLVLRIDEVIDVDYAFVFLPLWICGVLVIFGCFTAVISYILRPPPVAEVSLRWDFFAMIMSTIEHSILVVFEVLLYYKLRMIDGDEPYDPTLTWSVVFAPLFGLAILAITVMVWAVRFSKSFKFELFFTVNVVQFVFLALKLDNVVDWNWAIVFIPAWMVLAVCLIAVVYAVILAILLSRTMQMLPSHRRQHIVTALCHFIVVVPLLLFLLLLTGRLDAIEANNSTLPITTTPDTSSLEVSAHPTTTTLSPLEAMPGLSVISIPLFIALGQLTLLTFGSRGGNPWWFAMRKPFCNFVFGHSPCLQQYANISYKIGRASSAEDQEPELLETLRHEEPVRQSRIMIPIETLEAPD
ncbi:hypothetical protein QR680_014672 [Steinernema hermaphroditum]|uniref:Uncharacterized protein n=1 Tax=Steinernema hermaphroditum TaxID=289476 RepID=A0AA39IBY7_9BILA|nr:hypothetical protein QR680_014672 [Steinernema hermaphroditum]